MRIGSVLPDLARMPPLAPHSEDDEPDSELLSDALVALIDLLPFGVVICHRGRGVLRNAAARRLECDYAALIDSCRFGGNGLTRIARGDGVRALECRVMSPQRDTVAIVIADPDCAGVDSAALRELHGLTPAEIAIVRGILRGSDPRAIAGDVGVSTHTVRTHLRSIFAKTETRAQADLVRVLLRGIATLRDANTSNGGCGS